MIYCGRCKQTKESRDFYFSKGVIQSQCKECRKEKQRKYQAIKMSNPETKRIELERIYAWKRKNYEKNYSYNHQWRGKIRLESLKAYGGSEPKCKCCGESEIKFLAIDHINGGGSKHSKARRMNKEGVNIYSWLRKNGFPAGYQVLCHNCNCAKGYYKVCPHINNL